MKPISASLKSLDYELTTHNQGLKKVFLRTNDTPTKVTQVAYGEFSSADYCESHTPLQWKSVFSLLKVQVYIRLVVTKLICSLAFLSVSRREYRTD